MTLSQVLTNRFHRMIDPCGAVLRKGRLRQYGLEPGARLPVTILNTGFPGSCTDSACIDLIADTERFHAINRSREGILRWTARTAMILDVWQFTDGDEYRKAVSRRSKGNIAREEAQARRNGIFCTAIRPESYATSIEEIAASKRFRSGGPMLAAWIGPARKPPDCEEPPQPPACPYHWTMAWGAFETGEERPKLIAHFSLRRVGDMCRVFHIMRHGDYLKTGAMKLLYFHVLDWLISRSDREAIGVRWLMYGATEHGSVGLNDWKRRMLFTPCNLAFANDEARKVDPA